ncbi:myoglobin-like [Mercenaria mercenaria]|uniref:myoglobin-like n=1 Tax=Mercenaria mercenaria TaxID=6596 RepID=UPI001E1D6A11|nr:myoglobin-like [Mercenaria mercenaria]
MSASRNQFDDIAENMLIQLLELVRVRNSGHLPNFTSAEKIALRLSWNAFLAGDASKRGFDMFTRMFKQHPETQSIFKFAHGSSAAQMQNSSRLIFHVTRVVKYIGKVIENLDQLEEVVPMLKQLGGRHGTGGYNVPAKFFPYLGEAMRSLMKENVSNYSEKTNRLWVKLFDGFLIEQITIGQAEYGNRS